MPVPERTFIHNSSGDMRKACIIQKSGFLGAHSGGELSEAGFEVLLYDSIASQWPSPNRETIGADIDGEIFL